MPHTQPEAFALLYLFAGLAFLGIALAALAWIGLHRVRGHFFDSDGVRLHFTDEGQGEPVILIHGLAANADLNWRVPRVTRALAREFRVISLDARGHGLSDKPTDPAAYGEEMVRDVVRLMDHLGIEKAHVAGYSMGGFITLKLATTHPERLLSAACCAAGWGTFEGENKALFEALSESIARRGSFEPLIRKLEPAANPPAWKIRIVDWAIGLVNHMPALGGLVTAFPRFEVPEAALAANQVPFLTIVGTRDPIMEYTDALTGRLARHEAIVIRGTDHATTVFHPAFRRGLRQFLVAHSAQRAVTPAVAREAQAG